MLAFFVIWGFSLKLLPPEMKTKFFQKDFTEWQCMEYLRRSKIVSKIKLFYIFYRNPLKKQKFIISLFGLMAATHSAQIP